MLAHGSQRGQFYSCAMLVTSLALLEGECAPQLCVGSICRQLREQENIETNRKTGDKSGKRSVNEREWKRNKEKCGRSEREREKTQQYHHSHKPEKQLLRLLHSFIQKKLLCSFFQPSLFLLRPLGLPYEHNHHTAHLCQTSPKHKQTQLINLCVCVCWGSMTSLGGRFNISVSLMHKPLHVA